MSVSDRTGVFHVLGPAHLPSPASGVPDRIRATQQMSPHAEALPLRLSPLRVLAPLVPLVGVSGEGTVAAASYRPAAWAPSLPF